MQEDGLPATSRRIRSGKSLSTSGGPLIPGRLTTNFAFSHNEAENVDTIRATLPDGVFALGITRPTVNRFD